LLNKPSDSEVLVTCQGISKKFCRNLKKSLWYGVKDGVSEIVRGKSSDTLRKDEFWALDDVSFELRRGECLGLLGRNGAGKTTLLKVLSGLIKPDKGTITLKGKVGGLIALGAGFNGILSGRENIRINGAILGYSRDEIEKRMQEIIDFAEIPDFIDAPVSTYSSGMSVRLGFAIAAILTKPDVLLLDEVLAVGDIAFTIKCLNAVREMMRDSAVIFVSHNIQQISRFCTNVLYFKNGKLILNTNDVSKGINNYLLNIPSKTKQVTSKDLELQKINLEIFDNKHKKIVSEDSIIIKHNSKLNISFLVKNYLKQINIRIKLYILDTGLNPILTFIDKKDISLKEGLSRFNYDLGKINLCAGKYSFSIVVLNLKDRKTLVRLEDITPFSVIDGNHEWAPVTNFLN